MDSTITHSSHHEGPPLSRREVLALGAALGLSAAGLDLLLRHGGDLAAASTAAGRLGACVLTPELTQGPYYLNDELIRRDIREGRPGTRLELRLKVIDANSCEPIKNALVEVWHADAGGKYSGFASEGTSGQDFLRGGTRTDSKGLARITTIYPGWYSGRTPHIHSKVHVGGDQVHVGQLFFKEAVSNEIYEKDAYDARGSRSTTNSSDNIYNSASRMTVTKKKGKPYTGKLTLAVSP